MLLTVHWFKLVNALELLCIWLLSGSVSQGNEEYILFKVPLVHAQGGKLVNLENYVLYMGSS